MLASMVGGEEWLQSRSLVSKGKQRIHNNLALARWRIETKIPHIKLEVLNSREKKNLSTSKRKHKTIGKLSYLWLGSEWGK